MRELTTIEKHAAHMLCTAKHHGGDATLPPVPAPEPDGCDECQRDIVALVDGEQGEAVAWPYGDGEDGVFRHPLTISAGAGGPSEDEINASGLEFASYERGFSDALRVVFNRLRAAWPLYASPRPVEPVSEPYKLHTSGCSPRPVEARVSQETLGFLRELGARFLRDGNAHAAAHLRCAVDTLTTPSAEAHDGK